VSAEQPNIVVFWGNWGWGEVGCYGGGVLRGAPTLRIGALAVQGPCTPGRSALLTGRRPIRRPG
jgi:arylsulfatase A-like enzyme